MNARMTIICLKMNVIVIVQVDIIIIKINKNALYAIQIVNNV